MINVALCGYGYWGVNLLRNFSQNPFFSVVAVAERHESRRRVVKQHYPNVRLYDDAFEAIDAPDVQAVVIVTPVASHFPLAKHALLQGKHVFVEKPMCASVAEAEELVDISEKNSVTLMVDHTFLFHPAVKKFKELTSKGQFGHVSYYDSQRVNLGLFQPDVNVLWDLAPHDLSIIEHLFGEEPVHIEATGYCHLNPGLPDISYVTLHFPSRMVAHLNLSWMSPVKVRRIALGGTAKMAVWNDLDREETVKIYDCGIQIHPEEERDVIIPSYRIGDIYSPRLGNGEALAGVVEHFARVIRQQEISLMDGRKGLSVVRSLEAAQAALDTSLELVDSHYKTKSTNVLLATRNK